MADGGMSGRAFTTNAVTNASGQRGATLSASVSMLNVVSSANWSLSGKSVTLNTVSVAYPGILANVSGSAITLNTVGPATWKANANISGSSTVVCTASATITGIGALAGSSVSYTTLSPENLAEAVWAKVL